MRVQHRVGFTRNGRALRVADGQHLRTLLTRVTQCHQRVHGFTGLRNGHHQRARGENRITITEFVGKLHFHRNTHPMLDGVFGHHARVGGGTAGDDDNLVDRLEIMLVDANLVKIEIAVLAKTSQQRALHRRRPFVDLLVHEGVPTALFGRGSIPIHGIGLRIGHDVAHEIRHHNLIGGHHHGLILVDFHGTLRVGHERGHIGTEEILTFAKTNHQRRIMAGTDHDTRLTAVGGENRERAFQHARQASHGLEQIRLAGFLNDFLADFA